MTKGAKKSKMTLDKLATMTQREFLAVRKDIGEGFSGIREDLKHFSTKADLHEFKKEVIDEVRKENVKVIQSNDKVVTKLDDFLNDRAAHNKLHGHITDDLHHHDQRIKKLEAKI